MIWHDPHNLAPPSPPPQVSKPEALAPLVGLLLALCRPSSHAAGVAERQGRPAAFVAALARVTDDRLGEQLDFLAATQWPASSQVSPLLRFYNTPILCPLDMIQLELIWHTNQQML